MVKLCDLSNGDIKKAIEDFNKDSENRNPEHSNASYDYCFNYFREFYENGKLSEMASGKQLYVSCHYLGYYLATWGMLRASSPLFEKSVLVYEKVIRLIASEKNLWKLDVDRYTDDSIREILEFDKKLKSAFPFTPTDILTTKITLAVFGDTPAFDTYFSQSLHHPLSEKGLKEIRDFYTNHQELIDKYSSEIKTIGIADGKPTERSYTKAKIIDMIGFEINYK